MKLSKQLFVTLREAPADAEVASHALMLRAGFLQQVAAGIYVYAPMLWRVLQRIEGIVRDEHDRADCQEMLMPAIQPRDLWEESGRWDRYVSEGILFHFKERKGGEVCLGPTHEEVITNYVKASVQSYKQLPVTLYQIQTKFRDEIRPRFGLMRGREFIMKDAYSFDTSEEAMVESYKTMRQVYRNIFTRCGLRFTPVEADSGAIGGSGSEEFMVDADTGEDAIAVCRATGYAANLEKAKSRIPAPAACGEVLAMHKEPTPGATTCDALLEMFPELPMTRLLKTILYHVSYDVDTLAARDGVEASTVATEGVVAVMCRGDRELNETKLTNHLCALKVELASEDEVKAATGADVGYAGPIGLSADVRLFADESVNGVEGFLCGGNETDTHYLDVHFGRDLDQPETADFGTVQAGDLVVEAGTGDVPADAAIEITRGIEVGHIFQLGTKYSESMSASFLDVDQKQKPIWMGCYGIGVSRVAASAIEQNHDDAGMIWPLEIAPYACLMVQMKVGDEAQDALCQKIHDELTAAGVDVLWDERKKVRPGAKFKDADLIGIPLRIVVGRDAADDQVEWSPRVGGDDAKEVITSADAIERVVTACRDAGRR
ncbi:MAG: proline--tRNA ligase [Planctomycetota bacterium]|nr:proline--tRNA ligase [Planctomycetota bacterium]